MREMKEEELEEEGKRGKGQEEKRWEKTEEHPGASTAAAEIPAPTFFLP